MSSRYIIGAVCFGLFFAIIALGLQDFGVFQHGKDGDASGSQSGQQAYEVPDIRMQTIQGEEFGLRDINAGGDGGGTTAIVNFWASWCAPCIKEFPLLINKVMENPGKLTLIAISVDQSYEDMQGFLDRFPQYLKYSRHIKVVWDPQSRIAQDEFNVIFLPETFIINQDNKIVS
nr:TlpA family protein disulfide reductase [Gammaproteobacteria bacterium]